MSIACLIALIACGCEASDNKKIKPPASAQKKKQPIVISIQPFDDIPKHQVEFIASNVRAIYKGIEITSPIPLPEKALNAAKTRYRADSLIRFLSQKTPDGFLTIGLTTKDISTTKNGIPDWGIMGLGYCPGKSCIASTFRLHGKNRLEKLFKVSIHELGHTQGLNHCPVPTCLMRDAEGKDHLDEEKGFCPSCKKFLIKSGWNLQ